MVNNCLVTTLKGVVNNPSLKKVGEFFIEIKPSKSVAISWGNNFDAIKDVVRIVSGNATITDSTNGYTVVTDSAGCIIGVSNKYQVLSLNSSEGDSANYIIDADDFKGISINLGTVSRAKIVGNIENLVSSPISWFEYVDLSDAYGYLDLTKIFNLNIISQDNGVGLVATGDFTAYPNTSLTEGMNFKGSVPPISLSNCKVSVLSYALASGIKWQGNIATDLTVTNVSRVRLDGEQLIGSVETWIVNMIPNKTTGSFIRLISKSNMSINGQAGIDINYVFHFNADTITVTEGESSTVIGTYNKSSGTWSWV